MKLLDCYVKGCMRLNISEREKIKLCVCVSVYVNEINTFDILRDMML